MDSSIENQIEDEISEEFGEELLKSEETIDSRAEFLKKLEKLERRKRIKGKNP